MFTGLWFVLGLAAGSFLNVCIYRLPLGRSVVRPGSQCPGCGSAIRAYDNIPVLSWVLLRGRCRNCRTRISVRYPVVELATALLFVACALHFPSVWEIVKYAVLCFLLLGLMFSDLDHRILPDEMTLGGVVCGFLFSLVVWVHGVPGWIWAPPQHWEVRLVSLLHAAIGAAVGAGMVYLIAEIYWRFRGVEGMGLGDVKLMGMIGAFLGMRLALFTLFLASILSSFVGIGLLIFVYARRRRRYRNHRRAVRSVQAVAARFPLPFGVFLGAAAITAAFWGDRVLDWYWNMWS